MPVCSFMRCLNFCFNLVVAVEFTSNHTFFQWTEFQKAKKYFFCVFYKSCPQYGNHQRRNGIKVNSNFLARVTKHCGPWQRQASRHSNEFTYSEFPCSVKVKFDDPASSYRHWSVEKAKDFPSPLTLSSEISARGILKALSRGRDLPISFEYFRFPPALIYITFILNGESL